MQHPRFSTHTIIGLLNVAFLLLTAPVTRFWYNCWGATRKEIVGPMPGDDIVPSPRLIYTRAITINARPAAIWPWLVQMGQGRGGLYSYDGLENLVGCQMHSADRILPEHQEVQVGDHVLFGPAAKKFPGQVVMAVQPEKAIVMCGLDPVTRQAEKSATWVFALTEQADRTTRLVVRGRNGYQPQLMLHLLWHIVEPISFAMERQMLRGIKARAEYWADRPQA